MPRARVVLVCGGCAKRGGCRTGWLDEMWPTLGGGEVRVVACFNCRRLVVPFEGSERCSGRCGGRNDSPTAWSAECLTCLAVGDIADSLPDTDVGWACWEERCVRAWADEHGRHVVEITAPETGVLT